MRSHPDILPDLPADAPKAIHTGSCPYCKQAMFAPAIKPKVIDNTLYYLNCLVTLSPLEAALAKVLSSSFGRIIDQGTLIDTMYPLECDQANDVQAGLKVYIYKLRSKLSLFAPVLEIFVKHGYGYGLRLKEV